MATDYYTFFNIQTTATAADIKSKYRKLSFRYHPDHGGSIEDMTRLNEAYQVLSNPLLRRAYDQKRRVRPQSSYSSTPPKRKTPTEAKPYTHHESAQSSRTRPSSAFDAAEPAKHQPGHFWKVFNTVLVLSLLFFVYETYAVLNPSPSNATSTVATTDNTPVSSTPVSTPVDTASDDTPTYTATADAETTDTTATVSSDDSTSDTSSNNTTTADTTPISSTTPTATQTTKHTNHVRNFFNQQVR